MTENDHALDLYHILKRKFDMNEHPLTAWSTDNEKRFYYIQETLKEKDGYDETLEYVFVDVFQRYGVLGSGWGLDEESLYWIDHDEGLTKLENPKRSFLEIRGIDKNWESAGGEGIMRYFGLFVEVDYELPLTENGRMLSLHFSLAEDDGEEEAFFSII